MHEGLIFIEMLIEIKKNRLGLRAIISKKGCTTRNPKQTQGRSTEVFEERETLFSESRDEAVHFYQTLVCTAAASVRVWQDSERSAEAKIKTNTT